MTVSRQGLSEQLLRSPGFREGRLTAPKLPDVDLQASCVDDPVEARAIWDVRRGRVRSCVRPTLRGLMTAGPDAIRSLAPKQIYALQWRITLDGFFQAPGLIGSPSRHHRPPHPSAVATADGVPFGFRLRYLGLRPACDRLLHARAKPIRHLGAVCRRCCAVWAPARSRPQGAERSGTEKGG